MKKRKCPWLYAIIKWLVKLFYPKIRVEGTDNLTQAPVIIVGNHCQMDGPIASELYIPGKHYVWCTAEMMTLKEVPAYAYRDFWSHKPKWIRWFYKLLSYMIAPFSVCVFTCANTIPVYRDARVLSTFKITLQRLQEGANVVIFPEHPVPYNHILCDFQDAYIDIAKLYYKRTKKELSFVPMYLAPALKKMYFGKPIQYCSQNSPQQERKRITKYLMEQITEIAVSLPEHTVVPYENTQKKNRPSNIPPDQK